ncbi:MAG: class I SAM-dependent methyltransferase [Rickettsiales bacterium]|nr:class I SAM-dependent methyltransferase [Rickettsiales bacterium]
MDYIAIGLVIIASLALLAVLWVGFLNTYYLCTILFGVWPPSTPTDKKTISLSIQEFQKYFDKDKEFVFYDLGCGYGNFISGFAKAFPKAKIIGVDILYFPYFFSKFRFRKNKNITIIKDDLYNQNISKADAVFCFYCGAVKKLSDKLHSELPKNCLILSNNFELESLNLIDTIKIKDVFTFRKIFVYKNI